MDLSKLKINADPRGIFVEAFKFPHDGQISYIISHPNEVRGNHFHEKKTEKFLVIYGSATITSKDRETDNVMKVQVNSGQPMVVTIPPNNTHNIVAGGDGCVCLIWCDQHFDPKNPDTYQEEL